MAIDRAVLNQLFQNINGALTLVRSVELPDTPTTEELNWHLSRAEEHLACAEIANIRLAVEENPILMKKLDAEVGE